MKKTVIKKKRSASATATQKSSRAYFQPLYESDVSTKHRIVFSTELISKLPDKNDINFINFINSCFPENEQNFKILKNGNSYNYKAQDCFENVKKHIEKNGGSIVYGWTFVEYEALFFESEFHAVWKNPDGELVDLTPSNMESNLFLEDEKIKYNGIAIPNRFGKIAQHPYIDAYLHLRQEEANFQINFFKEENYNGKRIDFESYFNNFFNSQGGDYPPMKFMLLSNLRVIQMIRTNK